ncbi:MAG TPA: cyclodeaminase/cyclohydrolase family protein [Acidimicrobiales bacterium]
MTDPLPAPEPGAPGQALGDWLDDLASSAPAPGGGAAAAVNLAIGAALVSMVCNLTIGKPRYADHEATMRSALARAEACRAAALDLAQQDAVAFGAVSDAYRLPKGTDEEKAARRAAIQEALVGAAEVPLLTAERAVEVLDLAAGILEGANVNVVSDVAVAAAAARAALQSARVNVEINLAALDEGDVHRGLAQRLAACDVDGAAARADELVETVRRRIAG